MFMRTTFAAIALASTMSSTAMAACDAHDQFIFTGETCMEVTDFLPPNNYVNISLTGTNSSWWTGGFPEDLTTTVTCSVTTDVPNYGTVTVVYPFSETASGLEVQDGVNFSVPNCTEYTATCTHDWSWFGQLRVSFDTEVSLFAVRPGSSCPIMSPGPTASR